MTNNIVQVNVSQTIAPAPITLQQTGAFISQGGTTIGAGVYALITSQADLTAILMTPFTITSLTWASSVVTATTSTPHGIAVGQTVPITVAGAVPTNYNGSFSATATSTTQVTWPLIANPGTATTFGTLAPASRAELIAMGTTFFSQGSSLSVYVLELGLANVATGVTALTTFINANDQIFYAYLTPRSWSDGSLTAAFFGTFTATTSKTYFFVPMGTSAYTSFPLKPKSVIPVVEAPGIPATEYTAAAAFWELLHYNPSTTNQVTPYAFSYLVGVTPYPTLGNAALLSTLKTNAVNYAGRGSEGGLSSTILLWGTTFDGRDATYWYSVDWVQLNLQRDLANEIINGSNNPLAPLYYNQPGINRLQARAQGTMNRGVTFGLVLSPVTVAAVAFNTYVTQNPSDYPIGKYAGLSVVYTPARGFTQIIFNVNVTDFPAS